MATEIKTLHEELKTLGVQLKEVVDTQGTEFKNFSADSKEQLDKINTRISEVETKLNRKATNVPSNNTQSNYTEEEVEHKNLFVNTYLKKGRDFVVPQSTKAMASDDDTQGGYVVPKITRDRIIDRIRDFSPIRQIATVQTISQGSAFMVPIENNPDWGAGWVGEREDRPETANAGLGQTEIPVHEMFAQPAVTRRMIDDPMVDVESWVTRKTSEKFARFEGEAFVNGDGHQKPIGILQSNKVTAYQGTLGATTQFDDLIMMMAQPRENFQMNARWLMNRFTLAFVRTLKNQEGSYLWQPGVQPGAPSTILGKPYTIADNMPNAITSGGALISGNTPIVYGDFAEGYMIVDKTVMVVIRDEVTKKPFILYYTTKRVGGDVVNDQALVKLELE